MRLVNYVFSEPAQKDLLHLELSQRKRVFSALDRMLINYEKNLFRVYRKGLFNGLSRTSRLGKRLVRR
jgi:hypothetical protein